MSKLCEGCKYNFWKFIKTFYNDEDATLEFLRQHKVTPSSVRCPECNKHCTYYKPKRAWRCRGCSSKSKKNNSRCDVQVPEFKGTFFSKSPCASSDILCFINLWLQKEFKHSTIYDCLGWSIGTIGNWTNNCYQVTDSWFSNQNSIGGEAIEVEIDQTLFIKHAKNHNYTPEELWIFGGIERTSGKCFVVPLSENYCPDDISSLVKQFILPGSIIYSLPLYMHCNLDDHVYSHIVTDDELEENLLKISQFWRDLGDCTSQEHIRKKDFSKFLAKTLFIYTFKDEELLHHHFFIELAKLRPSFIDAGVDVLENGFLEEELVHNESNDEKKNNLKDRKVICQFRKY